MRYFVIFLCTLWGSLVQAQSELAEGPFSQLIIRGVTLINGNGAPPQGPVDVVIENDRITKVRLSVILG